MKIALFLISFLLLSCGTDQGSRDTYAYTLKNESGVTIKIIGYAGVETHTIILNNKQDYTQVYEDGKPPRGYHFRFLFGSSDGNREATLIKIVYNNLKFKVYSSDNLSDERNPLGPNHNNGGLEAIYTITQQDYENAEDCTGNCN